MLAMGYWYVLTLSRTRLVVLAVAGLLILLAFGGSVCACQAGVGPPCVDETRHQNAFRRWRVWNRSGMGAGGRVGSAYRGRAIRTRHSSHWQTLGVARVRKPGNSNYAAFFRRYAVSRVSMNT